MSFVLAPTQSVGASAEDLEHRSRGALGQVVNLSYKKAPLASWVVHWCQELTPDTIELPKKPDPATTEPSEKLFLSKTCFE